MNTTQSHLRATLTFLAMLPMLFLSVADAANVTTCTATFSVPLAETLTVQTATIGSIPDYAHVSNLIAFSYYKISSVELSRTSDMTINVALAGGVANTSFSIYDKGPTLLSLLTANGIHEAYASIYDRYLSFGQFSDAASQAKTILDDLTTATFQKSGGSQVLGGGKFLVSVKSRLVGSLLVPADYIDISSDYDSQEGHGLAEVISRNYGRIEVAMTPAFISLTLRSFGSYRIANDEYVYINFFNNFSKPEGCVANIPLVLHITSYQNTMVNQVASFAAFVILVVGLVMVIGGSSVPTSHHAGAVGMLATTRFAHEDGQALSFVLSPLQASVGSDKYQFVIGALIANCSLIIFAAVVQILLIVYLRRVLYLPRREAAGATSWPSIAIAFFAHFAPQIFFLLGRLLGRIDSVSIIIASIIVILMASAVVAMAKKVLSTNETFGAVIDYSQANSNRYNKELNEADRRRAHEAREGAFDSEQPPKDPLLSQLPVFGGMFKSTGEWVARRPVDFLLERWGFLFVHYRKKYWLIIEFADAMICGLVSVLDNYTSPLAMYQYGIFSASKLCIVILIIVMRPALKSLHTGMLVLSYIGQLFAAVALFVGSIRAETLDVFTTLKDYILVGVDVLLALHIFLVLFESVRSFYRRVSITDERRREFVDARERHAIVADMLEKEAEVYDVELDTVRSRSRSMVYPEGTMSLEDEVEMEEKKRKSQAAKSAKRLLPEFGFEPVQSTLADVLVEGHLPNSLAARQIEARNQKYDPRNVLPAQNAFRINSDGSVTFIGEFEELEGGEVRRRMRELKTIHGTVMIEPVYSTWGVGEEPDDDDSTVHNNDRGDTNSRFGGGSRAGSRAGGGSKFGGSSRMNSSSRGTRSKSASRFSKGSKGILGVGKGFKDSDSSSSDEDSDSDYDSEGLPVISVEQKRRKQQRRDERARRKEEKVLYRQGAMDADGDFLLDDADFIGLDTDGDDLLNVTLRSARGGNGGSMRNLNALRSVSSQSPLLNATPTVDTSAKFSAGSGQPLSLYGSGAKRATGHLANTTSAQFSVDGGGTNTMATNTNSASYNKNRSHSSFYAAARNDRSHSGSASGNGVGGGLTLEAMEAFTNAEAFEMNQRITEEKEEKARRKKEKKEQHQLSKGIVTSTANLCRHIPNGGVSIEQFFSFVDSVPGLSTEEKGKHKRRLADKIRTIYRDKAREAANRKKQEHINASLRLDGLNTTAKTADLSRIPNDSNFISKISESLKKGGVRGEPFGTSLTKSTGSPTTTGSKRTPLVLGYLTSSSSSSSADTEDDESAAESELMSAILGGRSRRASSRSNTGEDTSDDGRSRAGSDDGASSIGGRSSASRGAKSGRSGRSRASAATSVARSSLGSIRVPSTSAGVSSSVKNSATAAKKKRKSAFEDEMNRNGSRHRAGHYFSAPEEGGNVSHDWLILDDEVQNAAAHYIARALDTYEAAAVANATATTSSQPGGVASVDIPSSPLAPHQKLDAAMQRKARQSGTLIAVWESIGRKAGEMDSTGKTSVDDIYGYFRKDTKK